AEPARGHGAQRQFVIHGWGGDGRPAPFGAPGGFLCDTIATPMLRSNDDTARVHANFARARSCSVPISEMVSPRKRARGERSMVDVSLSVGHRGLRAMVRALGSGRTLGLLGVALPVLAGCNEKNAY